MITKNHGIVVTETLDLRGMMTAATGRSHRHLLSGSLMSSVLLYLDYKAQKHLSAPRLFPSSKRCSHCGHVKDVLPLSTRVYVCSECGIHIDRDLNAAYNLMQIGQGMPSVPVEVVP